MFFSVDKKTDHKKNISAFLTEGTAAWFLAAGILLTLEQWVDTGCPAVFYWMGTGIAILILQLLSLKKWALQGTFLFAGVILAAVLAGVNPETVHKWIKKEKVEAVQSSKTIRIPRQEFEGWLQGREKVEV